MNKHLPHDLPQMQSLPLEAKIIMSQQRIQQWFDHWDGMVYVGFSGGKDSTVLKHLVENTSGVYDVPSLFVNTGLEYPEIQKFAMSQPNVVTIRPKMRFDEVIKKYGYPVVSKLVSKRVKDARNCISKGNYDAKCLQMLQGSFKNKDGGSSRYNCDKWGFLLDAPFSISHQCCEVMKKRPAHTDAKETGRKAIIGTMASESMTRRDYWFRYGCNAFTSKDPTSAPLSFWTEQDILEYLVKYKVPYCSVYGEIKQDDTGKYYTTGCDRTGCTFCAFGCHMEKGENRFQRLKRTHPRQYNYCINGGEMVDGKWQPNKDGLGLGKVLDYIGVDY